MATYALGDVHGCFDTLQALLARIRFDRERDRLWLVGDLVNRGPDSLAVLRWAHGLGDRATVVLGNHDLHLLARAWGLAAAKPRDTLDEVLAAPDAGELLAWLRGRPLLARQGETVMVHAGLLPQWSLAEAEALARETSAALRGEGGRPLLASLRDGDGWPAWSDDLAAGERRRLALAVFTRLRTLTADGRLDDDFGGPPQEAPDGHRPWFEIPGRKNAGARVLFGHWAALGFHLAPGLAGLDSSCAWGGHLTALRLDDGAVFQERTREEMPPKKRR